MKITFVSGHHPINTPFAKATRKIFEAYTKKHGYDFYYEESVPTETEQHLLHYRRCTIL
jgi:hypothetical protein